MNVRTAIALIAASWPAAYAIAQPPPGRTLSAIVYGNDPCPRGDGDEIVVCGRLPEEERYRIPKELRTNREQPSEVSWASRVAGLEEASRPGRPNSCSPVGSYGQTGCYSQMLRQWSYERQALRAQSNSGR